MCKKCFCFLCFHTSNAEVLRFLSDPSAVRPALNPVSHAISCVPGWCVRKLSLPRPHPLQMLADKRWCKTGRQSNDRWNFALCWHFRFLTVCLRREFPHGGRTDLNRAYNTVREHKLMCLRHGFILGRFEPRRWKQTDVFIFIAEPYWCGIFFCGILTV